MSEATPQPPVAATEDHVRVFHGDRVLDPYEWLRDGESPRVQAHLEAENAYAEERTSHLAPLRAAIFSEIKSRVKETDLSVPVADGPWWYYGRTIEGSEPPRARTNRQRASAPMDSRRAPTVSGCAPTGAKDWATPAVPNSIPPNTTDAVAADADRCGLGVGRGCEGTRTPDLSRVKRTL